MNDKNKQKNCPVCNKSFTPSKFKPSQIYCNRECMKKAIRLQHKKWWAEQPKFKPFNMLCEICNEEFTVKYKHKRTKCCYKQKCKNKYSIKGKSTQRRLRDRIYKALKKQNAKKCKSTSILIGTSIKEFKQHIESQFSEGMSWDNHGEWHIDHIRPLSSFDLTQKAEQLKAFHYTNCQPLWAKDNIRKSNKY